MPRRNVWVTEEVDKLIKDLEINLSGFINEELPLKYSPTGYLKDEISTYKGKIRKLKKKLKEIKNENENKPGTNNEMIMILKEMNSKLKENPEYFNGMLKRFRNEFIPDLSKNKFKRLLREHEDDENLNRNDEV